LTFKNANITNYGAAIFLNKANLTLIGCEFLNNSAKRGGAIYAIDSAEIIIRDSIFMNNFAMDDGGAVYLIGIFSNFVFENSCFRNNYVRSNISSSAGSGGAVYIVSSKGFLKNCVFELNHATHMGGAVGLNDVIGTVENCVFNNNFVKNITFSSASSNGGALYLHNGNNTVINSNFTNNSAVNGGAIRTDANTALDGILNLKNSSFFNNSAINYGGALELFYFTAYISNCSFKFNNASNNVGGATDGGAIRSLSFLFIENSTFENNVATSRRSTGGAINHHANDLFLKNSTFINNHAYNGGAIYTNDACVSAYDSTFINNRESDKSRFLI
jgi:predicted outer membrane repeat protein